jgi:hypothetical protein
MGLTTFVGSSPRGISTIEPADGAAFVGDSDVSTSALRSRAARA